MKLNQNLYTSPLDTPKLHNIFEGEYLKISQSTQWQLYVLLYNTHLPVEEAGFIGDKVFYYYGNTLVIQDKNTGNQTLKLDDRDLQDIENKIIFTKQGIFFIKKEQTEESNSEVLYKISEKTQYEPSVIKKASHLEVYENDTMMIITEGYNCSNQQVIHIYSDNSKYNRLEIEWFIQSEETHGTIQNNQPHIIYVDLDDNYRIIDLETGKDNFYTKKYEDDL
jgi:hypothetical protein